MDQIVRQTVIVEPGGRVTVEDRELPAGARAEVTVRVEHLAQSVDYRALWGSGKGTYRTPEEADAFLRGERDAWDA
jgi:hypothetical protein